MTRGAPTQPWAAPEVEAWWHEVASAALLGTARRPVPTPPALGVEVERSDARSLLDQIALGASVRERPLVRRLAVPRPVDLATETRSAAPEQAVDVLRWLLHRPPVPERLARLLVVTWLRACDEDGSRVPGEVLPEVLALAGKEQAVRGALVPVLGVTGRRICAIHPGWRDLLDEDRPLPSDVATWQSHALPRRVAELERRRRADAATGLAWLTQVWTDEPARVRAELLPCLRQGLSADDEQLLETALADRSRGVRETAGALLDGLPTSRRAGRAAATLTPLVSTSRRRARQVLVVADPPEPDGATRRDGLDGQRSTGASSPVAERVRALVAGAPLDLLPGLTGWTPSEVVERADPDVVAGLVGGVVAESATPGSGAGHDWAEPLITRHWDARLLPLLDAAVRARLVQARLEDVVRRGDAASLAGLGSLLRAVPGRWPDELAGPVVAALAHPRTGADPVREVTGVLLERLPRSALPWLERTRSLRLVNAHSTALTDVHRVLEIRGTIGRTFR